MPKKPPINGDRRAKIEATAAWAHRVVTLCNELLVVLTEESDLPPMPLPADLNGWLALRYQVRQVLVKAEAELATIDDKG